MTRAHVWQTSSWLRWLLPAASPWRETAVGKPSSRSDQLSVQGEEVWSPQGQQPFPGGSLSQQESGGLGSSGCIGEQEFEALMRMLDNLVRQASLSNFSYDDV